MVPPITLSRPTRVFSRLPHTGEDKSLAAVCCDLSRVASIIPAHPLPENILNKSIILPKPLEENAVKSHGSPAKCVTLEGNNFEFTSQPTEKSSSSGSTLSLTINYPQVTVTKRKNTEEIAEPAKKIKLTLAEENMLLRLHNENLKKKILAFQMILRTEDNYNIAITKIREMDARKLSNVV